MTTVEDARRKDCAAKMRGMVCDLVKGHEGEHQAVLRWEPKLVGKAAAMAFIRQQGVHLHSNAAGRTWKLITKRQKQTCQPDTCIKFSGGGLPGNPSRA